MNFAEMDMKKEFEEYNRAVPVQSVKLSGGTFQYRYYKNPNPKLNVTIVMLAGGSGMADGFFVAAKSFMSKYSFISFNYPMDFKGNTATADAIAELITYLKAENVYFWGQSYGGLIAQIIAKRHPEVVKGLLLTSTASLSNNIRYEGMTCLTGMLNPEKEQKRYKMYRRFPMFLLPVIMKRAFKKHMNNMPGAYESVKELINQLKPIMTPDYFCHMTSLLCDLRDYFGTHQREDFAFLKGRVLIIEPDDDETFTVDIKEALFDMMEEPQVIRDMPGGHLAIMFNPDEFLSVIDSFLEKQVL